jgi:Flp pilus assembly protein CpaB
VREIELPADSDLVSSVATMATVAGGQVTAAQRIQEGDPITLTALSRPSASTGLRAMSLPIDRSMAVGGDLAAGDRVDVISVEDGIPTYVAVDLEVLRSLGSPTSSGALGSAALTSYYVTVSVDDRTALGLARALEIGQVSILRSTGAAAITTDLRGGGDAPSATASTPSSTPSSTTPKAGANG